MKKIKKIFKAFGEWIKTQWQNRFGLIADAKKIVYTMEVIRDVLKSRTAQMILQAIPGTTDERIVGAITKALDKVLGIVDAVKKDPVWMTNHPEPMQNAIIHKVASQAIRELHPKVTEVEADTLAQEIYIRRKDI